MLKILRDILIGMVGAVVASVIAIAAEEFFDGLSSLLGPEVPRGAVMAFEDPCPDGWKLYRNGKGRFLLGAGQADDGKGTDHMLRSIGGEERVTLAMPEMPRHRHDDRT